MAVWDVPHQRGAGLTLQVLHVGQSHRILSLLHRYPRMHPVEVARILDPGGPDASTVSRALSMLRRAGAVRHGPGQSEPGVHATFELTRFGAGMIASLCSLGDWGVANLGIADRDEAAIATVALFDRRWVFTLMMVIANAGPEGIRPAHAQDAVNGLMESQRETVRHRLSPSTRHPALNHLRDAGLVRRRPAPAVGRPSRVLYSATQSGRALMDALWPVAEWAIPFDDHLSACVGMMTTWWDAPDMEA